MSVIVKGMKMPTRCIDCPFMVSRENDDCIVQSQEANEKAETWEELIRNCPLVELPKNHGSLIDADELEKKCRLEIAMLKLRMIKDAPTIFEAEGNNT